MPTRSKVSPEMIGETLADCILPSEARSGSLSTSYFSVLFEALGYPTDRTEDLGDGDPATFLEDFELELNADRVLLAQWRSVDGIFQLEDEDIDPAGRAFMALDRDYLQSYFFLGLTLTAREYSRSQLAQIVRELNRASDVPIFVLFRYGTSAQNLLTFAIVDRRPSKQKGQEDRDVILNKVTMLKDIDVASPHRAHLEILADFTLRKVLADKPKVTNFDELHRAWERVLDTSELNKRFFGELSNWYFWAIERVEFPAGAEADRSVRNATSVIRLVSRLMFVWFLREKNLVDRGLFTELGASSLLRADLHDGADSSYYQAVLQNLFFATLNTERSQENANNRKFRSRTKQKGGRDGNYMAHSLFRYEDCFKDSVAWLGIVKDIPFLNGGLFECLDRYEVRDGKERVIRIDGFSDRADNPLTVPNDLFFGEERSVDLSQAYGQKSAKYKKAKVRGLLKIFDRYKFTVDENTPLEEDVALDPELLGKVFENLLASYNPETGTTARKQTGSFYTPREIVGYMVDEALIAYFTPYATQASSLSDSQDDCVTASVAHASSLSDSQDNCVTASVAHASSLSDSQNGCVMGGNEVEIRQRFLPHWRQDQATYFVTFRLGDSLPQAKLQELEDERNTWLKDHSKPWSEAEKSEYKRRFTDRIDQWLDAGIGECHLRDPQVAKIVADAMKYFDGERYILDEWVVMPNHVHAIVTPLKSYDLSEILHSWKSYSSTKINRYLGRTGKFWQSESYDRIIRSERHLNYVREYIWNNPKKANIQVTQASSLSDGQDDCVTESVAHVSSLSDGQDDCVTESVAQASSLSDGQDDCVTESVAQASSLSDSQDDCVTEMLRELFRYNGGNPFDEDVTDALIGAIDSIKVLDPACGSGAFPIGVLQRLVFLLGKLDPGNEKWKARQVEQAGLIPDPEIRDRAIEDIEASFARGGFDYSRKLFLIQNCIFGVDIQPVAVQITKLRCFIALIVEQRADENLPNRGILPLPNLETKFVAANSLISLDRPGLRSPEVIEKEAELAAVRQKHFTAKTPATKRKYRDRDAVLRSEIGGLLKAVGLEGSVADSLANWNPYDQNGTANFFESGWMFNCDRFDLVVGNPPYVRQEKIKPFKDIFKAQFECYTGTCDLFVYFFERGITLLKDGGFLSYICSNKYFRAGYGKKLREFLGRRSRLHQIIDFGDAPVFTAIAYPSIVLAQRGELSEVERREAKTRVLSWERDRELSEFLPVWESESFEMAQADLEPDGWRLESRAVLDLLAKLRGAGLPLGEFVDKRFYYGIKTGFNEAFVVDRATRDRLIAEDARSAEVLKPFLRGKDVKRWSVEFAEKYLIKIESSENKDHPWSGKDDKEAEKIFKKTYPAIWKFMNQYREKLIERYDQGKYFWELRSCKYWDAFLGNKILYPDIYEHQSFAFSSTEIFFANTGYFLPEGSYFLCGILNSCLVEYFYSNISNRVRGGYLRAFSDYMKQIPIPDPKKDPDRVTEIETLVQQILDRKQTNPAADVSAIEHEIDRHVYQLYDLTPDEIQIVETTTR